MHMTYRRSDESADRVLLVAWKIIAGLALAVGLMFVGTVLIESVLPDLPDQARAGSAMRPSELGIGGIVSRPDQPAAVEHFHAQFQLRPGQDAQGHVEAF